MMHSDPLGGNKITGFGVKEKLPAATLPGTKAEKAETPAGENKSGLLRDGVLSAVCSFFKGRAKELSMKLSWTAFSEKSRYQSLFGACPGEDPKSAIENIASRSYPHMGFLDLEAAIRFMVPLAMDTAKSVVAVCEGQGKSPHYSPSLRAALQEMVEKLNQGSTIVEEVKPEVETVRPKACPPAVCGPLLKASSPCSARLATFKNGELQDTKNISCVNTLAGRDEYKQCGNTVIHVLTLTGRSCINLPIGCEIDILRAHIYSVICLSADEGVVELIDDGEAQTAHVQIGEPCELKTIGSVTLVVRVPVPVV